MLLVPDAPRAERIATQLSRCADTYLGAVLHDWVQIDPAGDADAPNPALYRLVRALLLASDHSAAALPAAFGSKPIADLWSRPAVDAARRYS